MLKETSRESIQRLLEENGVCPKVNNHPLTGQEITAKIKLANGEEADLFTATVIGSYSFLTNIENRSEYKRNNAELLIRKKEYLILDNRFVVEPECILKDNTFLYEVDPWGVVQPAQTLQQVLFQHDQMRIVKDLSKRNHQETLKPSDVVVY